MLAHQQETYVLLDQVTKSKYGAEAADRVAARQQVKVEREGSMPAQLQKAKSMKQTSKPEPRNTAKPAARSSRPVNPWSLLDSGGTSNGDGSETSGGAEPSAADKQLSPSHVSNAQEPEADYATLPDTALLAPAAVGASQSAWSQTLQDCSAPVLCPITQASALHWLQS